MLAKEHIDDLLQRNGNVLTNDGDKIGSIGQVYADDDNGQPTWVTAKTGLFGTSESFVPLEGARVDGGDIRVPYTKDQVKDAPRVDTDGHLDPSEEDRLYAHYGLAGGGRTYSEATETAAGRDADNREADYAGTDRGSVGRDTSGRTSKPPGGCGCASTSPRKTSPRPFRYSAKRSGLNMNPSRTPTAATRCPARASVKTSTKSSSTRSAQSLRRKRSRLNASVSARKP